MPNCIIAASCMCLFVYLCPSVSLYLSIYLPNPPSPLLLPPSLSLSLSATKVPRHLASLDRLLEASTTGWLASTEDPSIADFVWVPTLQSVQAGWTGDADALKAFPRLGALVDKFMEVESVKAWYAKQAGEGKE